MRAPVQATSLTMDNIVPYFQPIMDLSVSRVWRYECLARLVTENDRTFLPNQFLHLLERQSNVQALAEAMFTQSARYFQTLNMPWNINLEESDLTNPALLERFLECLTDYPNPSRVSVEISAKTALTHPEKVCDFIEQSRPHGLGVFIDNVGTPPGNIKRLLALPIRGIKLAGGLVRHYDSDPEVNAFVDHLLNECQLRSIDVVAEHVESEELLDVISRLPIRYAQGFVFSKPQPTPYSVQ
ncbi:EAL domain-containing protein [Alteromonas sp. CYL-A6]|uniref:EAL domain-containing protein n=1 Tax=Alteromonas nitratireducens TaxID=3390813 RepID=UPI0034B266C8